MTTYIPYNFNTKENVTRLNFDAKITNVIADIKKEYELTDENIKLARHTSNYKNPVEKQIFEGDLIVYAIKQNGKLLSSLNCFISNSNDYMEINSYQ
ncbi:hypothetical protein [Flavobacterium pallidum]|uniref:Uncharacterized protein n=1 Tax=Flavobacterium pallidum TaxID=2172098 RepID=A0A2S1SKB1_9FLAO|nr:hypothetical protein [Flavobacterium pallidum]AWI26802.1 hypothetical protein HYN49_13340 [Flavobacterium pallidum]